MLHSLKNIRLSWPLVGLGIFYIYLGYHALSGSQGVFRWASYNNEISALEAEIESLKVQSTRLQIHGDKLRSHQLDLDVLDEESRRLLNVSHANEVVIWLDETP